MGKRPELKIMTGDSAGTRFTVGDGGLRLGRSSSNDIHIPDEELSRNHCLFETDGAEGIRVTDLASANGTYVNGEALGGDPMPLHPGDMIEVGSTTIAVLGDEPEAPAPAAAMFPNAGAVDLGLGSPAQAAEAAAAGGSPSAPKRSPLVNVLWGVAALVVAGATALVLCAPRETEKPVTPVIVEKTQPAITSLVYEKIEADASRIFRFQMTLDEDGVLRAVFDDVPGENRHVDKKAKLSEKAMKRIVEIFETQGYATLDDAYTGPSAADENELKSWRIRLVRGTTVKDVLVENMLEPAAFRTVREALEAFSRNELGIWALQYTREQLVKLSADSEAVADAKWDEREVEYGNLSAAVSAYREAVFYLDTVNPKPSNYAGLKDKLGRTEAELADRYKDQRFLADKAINLGDWESAQTELKILCALVPDKDDDRHAEANAKLVDVENRMKKSKGGHNR